MNSKLRLGPGVKVLEHQLKSIAEFENWKHSVLYNLRLDGDFKPYIAPGVIFGPKTNASPNRNLTPTTGDNAKSAEEKCAEVDLMLSQIAQFCPKIPYNEIVKDCGSLNDVWQVIRLHSNIETSGALLNDCWKITRNPDESPQALYSRLKQAYDDSLILKQTLIYRDAPLVQDEELSPTLHCNIILHWLQILHPKLRDLVTQRFGIELRRSSYASLFPEISRSVEMLLKELDEDASVCRFGDMSIRPSSRSRGSFSRPPRGYYRPTQSHRQCDYCRIQGRRSYQTHNIDECIFLKREKQQQAQGYSKAVEVDDYYDEYYEEYYDKPPPAENRQVIMHVINRVSLKASPVIRLYHQGDPVDLTLDTGGTASVFPTSRARAMNCKIRSTCQRARMADGETDLNVIGETDVEFYRDGRSYPITALVADMSMDTILAGMPFLEENDIAIRPAKAQIIIDGKDIIKYNPDHSGQVSSRRISSYTVHSPSHQVLLPGESCSYKLPPALSCEESVAVEPRVDSSHNRLTTHHWPLPKVHDISQTGTISLVNTTDEPVVVKKHEQICIVQAPTTTDHLLNTPTHVISQPTPQKKTVDYSIPVQVNPDNILSREESSPFYDILHEYDEVFNPVISRYNGKAGACFVEVNIGPNPPVQHKGRVPFYGRNNLVELQEKFDALSEKGVFRRPQDIGVVVEMVNPSFLVKKRSSQDKRLVTDFGSVAQYCRPTPTLMPDVDSTLRQIASWKYLIKTDLTEAYFQIPLKQSSMKYCGVTTPMKGIMVYTVGCMGLPGTEVALEELTCLLFGEMVMAGKVAKLADDLFIGGATPQELCRNLEQVLGILLENNLKLSAKKTIIAPRSVMILGWIWSSGFLKASPHRLSGLSECKTPVTVSSLKSFIGAYRFLSRVIKNYASLLIPLEDMIAGKSTGNSKLVWSDEKLDSFKKAQSALKDAKAISLPKPEDTLWIVTDAAAQPAAIGATLYAIRDKQTLLAGFYNAKLPLFQRKWLPCEIEGVAIGAALKHYSPYILQSNHKPCILTDSKPCIQAVEKLNRGEYSASARLCTFLSSVSRYQAIVKHIAGAGNVISDFISRNPVNCTDVRCQICKFLQNSMSSVVASVTVKDVLDGSVHLPFTNKKAWVEVQNECSDLRNVYKYLQNGTTPGKKGKNLRSVKRYISSKVIISPEGTLVVRQIEPLHPIRDRIVIPQQVLHGVLSALHLKLSHPTSFQLHKVFCRYFFALNLDESIKHTSQACHQCSAIKDIPKAMKEQSTCDPPVHIGTRYAADVIKRHGQNILVLRECTTAYTLADLIKDETIPEISQGLLRLCNVMRPSPIIPVSIRVDPAPANQSLFEDLSNGSILKAQNIKLEVGRVMNKDKNPVAEKAIRELIREILLLSPDATSLSSTTLSCAVANLNSRIRSSGLSAHETFTQRDQNSGDQLPIDDKAIINSQYRRRLANHKHSERSKAGNKPPHPVADINIGSLVYTYSDGSKVKARPKYIVISINNGSCELKRFAGKQLSKKSYTARLDEVYKVQDETDIILPEYPSSIDSNQQDDDLLLHNSSSIHKFPCSMCQNNVEVADEALQCDTCSHWCHRSCGGISEEDYRDLSNLNTSFEWSCPTHTTEVEAAVAEEVNQSSEDESIEEDNVSDHVIQPTNEAPLVREGRVRRPPDKYCPS